MLVFSSNYFYPMPSIDDTIFFEIMTEVIEEDVDNLEFELDEISWSSIAVVSCLAEFDEKFGILLNGDELSECKSVGDVHAMLLKDS